jgi:hypothetical protein
MGVYLQCEEYLTKPRNIDELKNEIKAEITAIPDNTAREAMKTLRDRLEQCRRDGGKHERCALKEVQYVRVMT